MISLSTLSDSLRFVVSATRHPWRVGAIWPSSQDLASAMAAHIDPRERGPVIELGSGTGAITEALIKRGIDRTQLILVESHPPFYEDLRMRFPEARCYRDDAYTIATLAKQNAFPKAAAIVSGLPLRTQSLKRKRDFIESALRLLRPRAPFIQFSYGFSPPVDEEEIDATLIATETIWKNIPPARVWIYRASEHSG
jgi:phosphatidylethanolamine/phosphatidyl-N-methylethanolamine N-methyltransferase